MSNYHVYILSYNGVIFYIGMSQCLSVRIQQHYSDTLENTYHYIKYIESIGGSIDIEIIAEFDNKNNAALTEYTLIKYHVSRKIKLFNKKYNPIYNRVEINYKNTYISAPSLKRKGHATKKFKVALDKFKKLENDIKKT